jgi:hypothetical protein
VTECADSIRDRDTRFAAAFDTVSEAERIQILRSPVRAPRVNAICERMIDTIRQNSSTRSLICTRTTHDAH